MCGTPTLISPADLRRSRESVEKHQPCLSAPKKTPAEAMQQIGNIWARKRPFEQCLKGRNSLSLLHSGDRTRTCDPLINSQLLYQLSYAGSIRTLSLVAGHK